SWHDFSPVFILVFFILYSESKLYHNGCIDMVSPQCVFSDDLQDDYSVRTPYHNGCIDMVSFQSDSSCGFEDNYSVRRTFYIVCIYMASPLCVFSDALLDIVSLL
ncbi:unnamed protein product, partial [Meganyctiphanes norvegica]